jgi:hypothetical protein
MGCGCGRKSAPPRVMGNRIIRPSVGPKSIARGTAGPSPATLRALGLQSALSPTESVKLDEKRRTIEKLRREAVKKKFNK